MRSGSAMKRLQKQIEFVLNNGGRLPQFDLTLDDLRHRHPKNYFDAYNAALKKRSLLGLTVTPPKETA